MDRELAISYGNCIEANILNSIESDADTVLNTIEVHPEELDSSVVEQAVEQWHTLDYNIQHPRIHPELEGEYQVRTGKDSIGTIHLYGEADLHAYVNSIPTLIDFKVTRSIKTRHRSQMAAYYMLAIQNNIEVDRCLLVYFWPYKDADRFEYHVDELGIDDLNDSIGHLKSNSPRPKHDKIHLSVTDLLDRIYRPRY